MVLHSLFIHLYIDKDIEKELYNLTIHNIFHNFFSGDSSNGNRESGYIQLEQEVLSPLAGTGRAFVMPTVNWWSQLKSAGSAIYANRHYLALYRTRRVERLANKTAMTVIGDVYIHPTASIHATAVVSRIIYYMFLCCLTEYNIISRIK